MTRSSSSAIRGRSVGGFVIPVAGSLHPVARTAEQLDVVRGVGTVLAERVGPMVCKAGIAQAPPRRNRSFAGHDPPEMW